MFFTIAPKQMELQSCARTQIEDKNALFKNFTLIPSKDLKEAPNAWAFIRRALLEKYLVYLDLPQSGFTVLFINASAKNASFVHLRYLELDLTVEWVIGGILRKYFSCLYKEKDIGIKRKD